MTMTTLRLAAKKRGYIVKKLDGEIEIYPKGERGEASYFTNEVDDAFNTMREDFVRRQANRIKQVTAIFDIRHLLPAEEALIQYATASGHIDWPMRLASDWYRGGSTTVDSETYSILHRLRNHPDGYEMLRQLDKH